ncbi:MAG: carbon monoxide dehydrogenase, partial [Acidobacteria bacterium]
MQISGSNHLSADPATAWEAFHDESVLVATLPGAQSMREVAPGSFEMTVSAGVAAIRGTYDGTAVFSQEVPQESFVLSLAGAGGPGTINADVKVEMAQAADGGTDLTWTADATVGGPVGGVGQRMLSGVAKRLAGQFFANID